MANWNIILITTSQNPMHYHTYAGKYEMSYEEKDDGWEAALMEIKISSGSSVSILD